jgi:hypothetical protein
MLLLMAAMRLWIRKAKAVCDVDVLHGDDAAAVAAAADAAARNVK